MSRIIVIIFTVVVLGAGLVGAGYASYNGFGVAPAETESARMGSTRGIFIIGGGPGFGGK